jgi:hypothetical protein
MNYERIEKVFLTSPKLQKHKFELILTLACPLTALNNAYNILYFIDEQAILRLKTFF